MKNVRKLLAATSLLCLASAAHAAPSNIMFILDGSGSMWGQIDKVAKIETAKDTMIKLMDDLPEDTGIGLMTYGTKDKKSCKDVVQLNKIGSDRKAIKASINDLTPLGKTPIALALEKGIANLVAQAAGQKNSLVLISDGIETCDGDPCGVAKVAKNPALEMKVHVVGYDVDAEAREQLECIAKASGGQYFDTSDTGGFQKAVEQVVEVAQAQPEPAPEPEPVVEEPKGPTITEFFRDDFDGDELAEHWAISNPNPDNFILEDGTLVMLSTSEGGFNAKEPQNLITYTGELPKGDWDAELTFIGDYGSAADRITLGLRKDETSYLAGSYTFFWFSAAQCTSGQAHTSKVSKGKEESVTTTYRTTRNTHCRVSNGLYDQSHDQIRADHQTKPLTLTFSKRGRAYTTTVAMEGWNDKEGNPVVMTTNQFTSLRSPGELSFNIDRVGSSAKGEVLMNIDSFVINTVEE